MPMRSPFPGIDPYLEAHWPSVHGRLITYIADALNDILPGELRAEMEERVLIDAPDAERPGFRLPDVYVTVNPGSEPAGELAAGGVAVAEPILLEFANDPIRQRFIEIYDASGRIVTAIEVLSPSNKCEGRDRDDYLKKREEYISGEVNVVEIDLIRSGERTLIDFEYKLPRSKRSLYVMLSYRAATGRWYATPLPVRAPLPGVKIPLRKSDADAVLFLQPLLDLAYKNGRCPIDYSKPPAPPLRGDDVAWASELLTPKA